MSSKKDGLLDGDGCRFVEAGSIKVGRLKQKHFALRQRQRWAVGQTFVGDVAGSGGSRILGQFIGYENKRIASYIRLGCGENI